MKAVFVLVTLLLFVAPVSAQDWSALIPVISRHVGRVEIQKGGATGVCSSVVFEIDKHGFAHAMTAAHCVDRTPTERIDVTVNGRNAVTIHSNNILDLAILRFRAKDEVPIQLARVSPVQGAHVAIVGFAFGVEELVAQFGYVAQTLNRETKALWINADLIFGDSGGPLIDYAGKLIGINSRIYTGGPNGQMAHIGAAVPIEQIADFIDDFRDIQANREKK
jgi:S1-C subfamily serine protease